MSAPKKERQHKSQAVVLGGETGQVVLLAAGILLLLILLLIIWLPLNGAVIKVLFMYMGGFLGIGLVTAGVIYRVLIKAPYPDEA